MASAITSGQEKIGRDKREGILRRLHDIVQRGNILCLPSAPRAAPLKGTETSKVEVTYRNQVVCLLCIAGIGGLPQVSLPMARIDGLPIGLSLIGAAGSDLQLPETGWPTPRHLSTQQQGSEDLGAEVNKA